MKKEDQNPEREKKEHSQESKSKKFFPVDKASVNFHWNAKRGKFKF